MKHDNRMLWAAAAMGMAALVLAGAGTTIALIAAARPPVSKYLSAAENAEFAARQTWWGLGLAALMLLLTSVNMAQIIARRPFWTPEFVLRGRIVTRLRLVVVSAVFGAVLVMFAWIFLDGVWLTFIERGDGEPITNRSTFRSLALQLNGVANLLVCLSILYLLRWWQVTNGVTPRSAVGAEGVAAVGH